MEPQEDNAMKEYLAPDIEKTEYDLVDCLTGSNGIEVESHNISNLIGLLEEDLV